MSSKKNLIWVGAVIILILSVITFVFIPTASGSSRSSTLVFGKWNDKPIEYVQDSFFIRQIQSISEQMQSKGQEINQFSSFQIMQSAFNSAAIRFAIMEQLDTAGYRIPDSLVNKNLIKYYQDENGKYSSKLFAETAESTRTTRRNIMAEELTANRYVEDTFGSQSGIYGLKTSSKETDLVKSMSSPERSFAYVSFATSAYPDSEVVAWGQAHTADFVRHNLSLITVATEAQAKKVAASIAKKEITFEDAVTTYSTRSGTDTAGKLTNSWRKDLGSLFEAKELDTVLALQPGSVSPVLKTGDTFAIVRCDGAPVEPSFDEPAVLEAAKSFMETNNKGIIEDYFKARAAEFAAQARTAGFDTACKSAGLEKKTTAAFGINYGNANIMTPVPVETNTELAPAIKSDLFFRTAFALAPGAVSEPVVLGSNVVVLQMVEEKSADPQVLEMVPMFYGYYAANWSQTTLSDAFLKSDKLENNFMDTYLKHFMN